jgi:hypothetical protein
VIPTLALAALLAAPPTPPTLPQAARPPAAAATAPAPASTSPAPVDGPLPPGVAGEAVPLSDAPAAWAPAIRRAEEAGQAFQKALQARLVAALAQGGPPAAVEVCATEAAGIAREQSAAAGVRMGRTSDRLRNPGNAPPAWSRTFVLLSAGEKAKDVPPLVVDLGAEVGVLLPIAVRPACLGCHGPAAGIAPKVKEALAARYPRDQATGYADGDFRGFLWVEARK